MSDITVFCINEPEHANSDEKLAVCATAFTGDDGGWKPERPFGEKPYFSTCPELGFSVTHSGDFWLCAMSWQPVGLDLQQHQPCPVATLSRRFLHPDEDQWLVKTNYARFFDLWAAKESYLKYTGSGIVVGLDHFSLVENSELKTTYDSAKLSPLEFRDGYSLCLCAADIGVVIFRNV